MASQPLKVVTLVYDVDVETMTKDDLTYALKQVIADKKALVAGLEGVESTFVNNKIASFDVAVEKILSLLDA